MDWTATWTAVGAFGTLSLAAATFYLALQSRRTIGEMAEQRKLTIKTVEEMAKQREVTTMTVEEMVKQRGEMARQREATYRTVAEMETARELALMPMLKCKLLVHSNQPSLPVVIDDLRRYTVAVISNIGNAPALETNLVVICPNNYLPTKADWPKDEPESRLMIEGTYDVGSVGLETDHEEYLLEFGPGSLNVEANPVYSAPVGVELRYKNFYGRVFKTTALWHCTWNRDQADWKFYWRYHREKLEIVEDPTRIDPPLAVFRS